MAAFQMITEGSSELREKNCPKTSVFGQQNSGLGALLVSDTCQSDSEGDFGRPDCRRPWRTNRQAL